MKGKELQAELVRLEGRNRKGEPCWSTHWLAAATQGITKRRLSDSVFRVVNRRGGEGLESALAFDGVSASGYPDWLITAEVALEAYRGANRRTEGALAAIEFFEERLEVDRQTDSS